MSDDVNPILMDSALVKKAGELLGRAFQDDPVGSYHIPDPVKRARLSHYKYEMVVRIGLRYGEVYITSDKMEGLAVWLPSGKDVSWLRMMEIGAWVLPLKFGLGFIRRMMKTNKHSSAVHYHVAPFPHLYLAILGVDPAYQGKGYAGNLLTPMLDRLDKQQMPCYLDTEKEENVPIYERFGFRVVDVSAHPGTDLKFWAMLRK